MKDLKVDNKAFGSPSQYYTQECTSSVESGAFIGADGGYIKLGEWIHNMSKKIGLQRNNLNMLTE